MNKLLDDTDIRQLIPSHSMLVTYSKLTPDLCDLHQRVWHFLVVSRNQHFLLVKNAPILRILQDAGIDTLLNITVSISRASLSVPCLKIYSSWTKVLFVIFIKKKHFNSIYHAVCSQRGCMEEETCPNMSINSLWCLSSHSVNSQYQYLMLTKLKYLYLYSDKNWYQDTSNYFHMLA